MVRVALLVLMLSACGHTPRVVKAEVPTEIYECRPTTKPKFRPTVDPDVPIGLTWSETAKFKTMVLQAESCLKAWRQWSE